ncbi:plexin-B2-like [Liolophura sinensis]|uniref:plexin-B2-like n=1 Tax=Liolophura sinensis TaxID=3198878 RepID=UPI00315916B2
MSFYYYIYECRFSKENSFGMIQCRTPPLKGMGTSCAGARIKRQAHNSISVGFKMDNVTSVQDTGLGLEYVDNPVYNNLSERTPFKAEKLLYITGKNLTAAATIKDIKVYVCNSSCMITNLNDTNLMCTLPKVAHGCAEEELPIKVIVGYAEYNIGSLQPDINTILEYILPSAIISAILLVLLIVITLKFRRHKQKRQRDMERIQNQYELLERNVRQEARQEFADLQQDIKLVTSDVIRHGVPYKELSHYTYAMLFPADIMSENFLLNHSQTGWVDENFNQNTLKMLDSLVGNKFFLLTCLRALETEKKMTARDKSYLANIVTVILLDKLDYLMQIWMELFKEHVSRAVERKQQKQIMRRNETIVEKMISNWLSLCMYDNMKNHTGSSLYMLYKATEMLTDYGPVDAVTGEAHYTLSEERLLKETIRNEQLTITVDVSGNEYSCKVLDCDAISQVKQKCLNQIYTSAPVSERPREEQVDLEWHSGKNGRLILNNFDNTTEADGEWRRINTLKHFNVKDGSKMALLSKEDEGIETDSPYGNIGCSSASLISTNDINVDEDSRIWHLVRTEDNNDDSKQCVISEIYLTRLMSTKVPLLTFLDHFVETVFSQSSVPVAVKFLFDYFDQLASDNGLNDSDVCHIWKSNTLPIRYWGKLLKAPHHAFDVCKPDLSEPSLEVLAQCFIDSCSLTELRMGKDSPASKLLFSKDVIRYRQSVSTFYDRVEDSSAVSEQDITEELSNLSMALHANNLFSKTAAFYELSKVVKSHECKIIEALEENPEAKKLQLGHKLEEFLETMTA